MTKTENPEWRIIPQSPQYEASENGDIRKKGGELLKQYRSDRGYMKVTVSGKTTSVHRLVATAFIANPFARKEVNHRNGEKSDNRACNLEWCTRSQNMKHAYACGLHPGVSLVGERNPNWGMKGSQHPQSMAVRAIFPNGEFRDYASQRCAAADGFRPDKISECVNGKRGSHGGAVWRPLPPPPAIRKDGPDA